MKIMVTPCGHKAAGSSVSWFPSIMRSAVPVVGACRNDGCVWYGFWRNLKLENFYESQKPPYSNSYIAHTHTQRAYPLSFYNVTFILRPPHAIHTGSRRDWESCAKTEACVGGSFCKVCGTWDGLGADYETREQTNT